MASYVESCMPAQQEGYSTQQHVFAPFGSAQGFVQQDGSPLSQGFIQQGCSPNGFIQQGCSPNGVCFMPLDSSPNGQCFMQQGFTPSGPCFMQQGCSPNGPGFMQPGCSPNGPGFMQGCSPNGPGFMPQDSSPNGQGFVPALNPSNFVYAAPQECPPVPEKVLRWLSGKALATLGEALAEEAVVEAREARAEADWGSETDEESESEEEEADAAFEACSAVLAGLVVSTVGQTCTALLPIQAVEPLGRAIVAKAASDPQAALPCANLVVLLLEKLPYAHRRESCVGELVSVVVQALHASLEGVDTEAPPSGVHGATVLLAELFKRQLVGLGEAKALFGRFVFGEETRPQDHCASLACHLFLTIGPFLERSAQGRKLSDCMCARLRELKGINFSEATLFSLAHVTELKLNKWVPKKEASKPKKQEARKQDRSVSPKTEDKVLLIGQLFAEERVATQVVKELFQQLLFTDSPKPALAAKLLGIVAPTLDRSEAGAKLVEYAELRLGALGQGPGRSPSSCRSFAFPAQKENRDVNRVGHVC